MGPICHSCPPRCRQRWRRATPWLEPPCSPSMPLLLLLLLKSDIDGGAGSWHREPWLRADINGRAGGCELLGCGGGATVLGLPVGQDSGRRLQASYEGGATTHRGSRRHGWLQNRVCSKSSLERKMLGHGGEKQVRQVSDSSLRNGEELLFIGLRSFKSGTCFCLKQKQKLISQVAKQG